MSLLLDRRWRLTLIVGVVTALAGIFLVGISAWFLGAVAIAGLGPAAYTFGFHHPAALVRGLALLRTVGKYTERVAGHTAALADQTAHRSRLFLGMSSAAETRSAGWQLARADRLQTFLRDVEDIDFFRLRVALPRITLVGSAVIIAILTVSIVPLALPAIAGLAALLLMAALCLADRASTAANDAEKAHLEASEAFGQQLTGLVSLEGGAERAACIAETSTIAQHAEVLRAEAKALLGYADTVLAAFGPSAAVVTLIVAYTNGLQESAILPALLVAFLWLAFGETLGSIVRARFAQQAAQRATTRLAPWSPNGTNTDNSLKTIPARRSVIAVDGIPLRNPLGDELGQRIRLCAAPGQPAALLGPSGCGKTSFLKMLAGWLPWKDGPHPLGDEEAARALVHLSLHDAAILEGTFRDNLFSSADDKALWEALRTVELEGRVRQAGGLNAGIDQTTLSLGEARRIALARALLTHDPIVLFDEPGEHLDQNQGLRIFQRVLSKLDDRGVLFVTHDRQLAALASHVETIA
ncbi:MAG: ATP-binding cassette domain-containing protein [Pseudomonadota bacterium]